MRVIFTVILLSSFISLSAQTKQEQAAIKDLCGCFQITFKYAETFSPIQNYTFPKRYNAEGLEWITPVEQTDKKFVLQHLLLIDDSTIIKHWREDWEYAKKDLWLFQHDATWKHVDKNNKGEWIQTVWEVDDAPRYQGSSKWIENNGQYYWENTADAPLPRREYTKRNDYNVMKRTNKIIVTDSGWTHEQDNEKIIRKDDTADVMIAQEKGYNIYHRVPDSKCAAAVAWWDNHKDFWAAVRRAWNDVMKNKKDFHLTSKIDGQLLYEQLDKLEDQNLSADQLKAKLTALINTYASVQKQSSTIVRSK
ncbi:MAG TPA: DUF6607 family protein [Parafilimonas sp.]|nr:DUF6607 family protein [Parafilimonas sp.]